MYVHRTIYDSLKWKQSKHLSTDEWIFKNCYKYMYGILCACTIMHHVKDDFFQKYYLNIINVLYNFLINMPSENYDLKR